MAKNSRSTKKSASQDPSEDLLKSLMEEISIDEAELSQVTNASESPKTSKSKSHSMPDGLDLATKVEELTTSMLIPGMKSAEEDEDSEDLAILLDQNFNESTQLSQVNEQLEGSNIKMSQIPPKPSAAKPLSNADLENNGAFEIEDVPVIGINEPTVFARSDRNPGQSNPIQVLTDKLAGERGDEYPVQNVHEIPAIPELATEVMPSAESLFKSIGDDIGKGLTDFRDRVEKNLPLTGISQVSNISDKTVALSSQKDVHHTKTSTGYGVGDKTVAVAGFSDRNEVKIEDKVKVSIGEVRPSSPLAAWGKPDSNNIGIAHNLEIAQEKILRLEQDNAMLRQQNDELVAAAEVIKERADLLANELSLLKEDRDSLDQSFKNELLLLKNQMARKDSELERVSGKAEELESMLRFDMKKIRVRERELENRLELLRSEKNALVKSKDEMILDLRRKCDQFQLETESFRQKCIELNKVIEASQDSVKRTTRALRLAMANLELQDENKQNLKKAE